MPAQADCSSLQVAGGIEDPGPPAEKPALLRNMCPGLHYLAPAQGKTQINPGLVLMVCVMGRWGPLGGAASLPPPQEATVVASTSSAAIATRRIGTVIFVSQARKRFPGRFREPVVRRWRFVNCAVFRFRKRLPSLH